MGVSEGWALDVACAASLVRRDPRFPHHPDGGGRGCEGVVGDRVEARIKWPNDLLAGGKKICGILAESSAENPTGPSKGRRLDYAILGVGMNANLDPAELGVPDREVTTIRSELSRDVDPPDLLRALLSNLDAELGQIEDFGGVLEDWRSLNCTLGQKVRVRRFGEILEGHAVELSQEGALLLATPRGTVEVFEGELEHLRFE